MLRWKALFAIYLAITEVFLKGAIKFLANVNSRSRSLYAIAVPSVVCLSVCRLSSVTLVRPTQPVEIFGNLFHHTIALGL